MRYAAPHLRRIGTRLLAREMAGQPATSERLAAAAARLLDRLSARLAEVIGPAGVHAIFLRAVKLRTPEFPFLDEHVVPRTPEGGLADSLRARLQEQPPEAIEEASVILFATCAGLLATVIGDRLTGSLLQQIWPDTLQEAELRETEE